MQPACMRPAMWSGPRNISTAMMRSFGQRDDCAVIDEPLYAAYLAETGLEHPMRDEVLGSQSHDWRAVVEVLTRGETQAALVYQKHMTHHLLPSMGRDWLDALTHAFLIREPRAVAASYRAKRDQATPSDLGFPQQREIFDRVCDRLGKAPPVIDAADILANPEATLRALCAALGLSFQAQMLSWPPGRRATDGVWAAHWYERVEASTGFAAASTAPVVLDAAGERLAAACRPHYDALHVHRLTTQSAQYQD